MRRHPLDVFSLLSGLLVLGFAVAYLVGAATEYRLDARLAVPLLLVGLGAAGLAALNFSVSCRSALSASRCFRL